MARLAALPVLCLLACNGSGKDDGGFSMSGVTSVSSPASTGEGSSTGTGASSGTSTGAVDDSTGAAASSTGTTSTTGPVPDQGAMPDFDDFGGKPVGCKGKIDFLFSISASNSMEEAQARLKASFPGFLATIEQEFADFDSHIMVANTGGLHFLDGCEGCEPQCPDDIPDDFPCDATFETCDKTRGAGVTFPTGFNASNKRCDMYGQYRFIRQEHPDPLAAFTCIASVGTDGANAVVEEALGALSDDLKPCNYGFLRDDALLVLTIITRGDDYGSQDQPPDWTKALLAAKGGDPDASVVLIVMDDSDLPDGVCKPHVKDDLRLRAWAELLPHVRTGSVCAPNFAPFFADAAALVKQQCESFIPG